LRSEGDDPGTALEATVCMRNEGPHLRASAMADC
jgi:hypothetical protein